MRRVPLLLTLDVHPVPKIGDYVRVALDYLRSKNIRATFFFTTTVLESHVDLARRVISGGHEIGAHGLLHNAGPLGMIPPERYDQLTERNQRQFLWQSTEKNWLAVHHEVRTFRGPSFGISGTTIRLLEELGYVADLSVNSQRLDLLTSRPFTADHLLAPRLPYHPSHKSAFRRGESALMEIPLSAAFLPFSVTSLMAFGVRFSKLLFRGLLSESRLIGKPIVYMGHPEEFSPFAPTYGFPATGLSWRHFAPKVDGGIAARKVLLTRDPVKLHRNFMELLQFIRCFEDVQFLTVGQYLDGLRRSEGQDGYAAKAHGASAAKDTASSGRIVSGR